jgi:hypothetical protein
MCEVPYASAVESLICYDVYKHDICYAIGLVTRYQSDPGQAHWKTVKRILKCLESIIYHVIKEKICIWKAILMLIWRKFKWSISTHQLHVHAHQFSLP